MSTKSLCEKYVWSPESEVRNELTSYYEPAQPFVLLSLARRVSNAVFIDVGANIGFYTVVIGCEPTMTEVYSFEPMPLAAAAVRWNAHANLGDKSVTIRELALSDHSGELEFAVVSPLAGDNGALADSPYERHHIKVLRVRCGRLDDELRLEGRNILLKVDVEGHELSVLEGATTVLSANRGFMQIEMHESPSLGQKIEFLNDLGWHQISRVGPDHYFSNISSTYSDAFRAEMLEGAMGILVDSSKCARRASRRRIATGVYLEVSRKKVDAVKRLLRR